MEAAAAAAVPAVGVRDRLAGFVDEVTRPFVLRRQRENALLYVRGLIEHGGRKSLQPTLFRLEETRRRGTSRCSSFWPTRPGIRSCWCGLVRSGWRRRSALRPGLSTTPGSSRTASIRRG